MSTALSKLDSLCFQLYGFASARSGNSYQVKTFGYGHTTNVIDAARKHAAWKKKLRGLFDDLDPQDQDFGRIREACEDFFKRSYMVVTPEMTEHLEKGILYAAGVAEDAIQPTPGSFEDIYGDEQQKSVGPWLV